MYYQNKICWITGASSGIGEAIAYELAKHGAHLVLSARSEAKLSQVAKRCMQHGAAETLVLPIDLGVPSSIADAFKSFQEKYTHPALLIHNGGISQRAVAAETNSDVERNIMEVNYFGTIYLTKLVMPILMHQKSGQLAVTSSIAGKFGFPLRTSYSASKHAVQGYFESLRTELLPYNIGVNIIIPGRVRTEISKHALDGKGTATDTMDKGLDDGISPEIAAKKIVRDLAKGKKEILVGGKELLMVFIRRYTPWLFYKIVSRISPT